MYITYVKSYMYLVRNSKQKGIPSTAQNMPPGVHGTTNCKSDNFKDTRMTSL